MRQFKCLRFAFRFSITEDTSSQKSIFAIVHWIPPKLSSNVRPVEVKLRYFFLHHQALAFVSYLDNKVQKGASARTKISSLYFNIQDWGMSHLKEKCILLLLRERIFLIIACFKFWEDQTSKILKNRQKCTRLTRFSTQLEPN